MTNKIYPPIAVADPSGNVLQFSGRTAWALRELLSAGKKGCTPIEYPGPRWSAYIRNLREAGIDITTIFERHGGVFPGNHGRYVLRSTLRIIECENV